MTKPIDGKKLLEETKSKVNKQKENNMNKSNIIKTIITVTITLITVAAFAFTFYQGVQFGASNEKSKNDEVHAQVKSLTVVTKK